MLTINMSAFVITGPGMKSFSEIDLRMLVNTSVSCPEILMWARVYPCVNSCPLTHILLETKRALLHRLGDISALLPGYVFDAQKNRP